MAKHEQDQLFVTNPTDTYFSWPWSGQDYGVAPGQKIIWPRFLAEHYAKHLADFILLKKEKAKKDEYMAVNHGSDKDYKHKSLLNSKKERPPVIESILTGVYSYFRPVRKDDPNAQLQQQISQMNPQQNPNEPKPLDLGQVDEDKATGVLKEEPPELTGAAIGVNPGATHSAIPSAPLPGQTTIPLPPQPAPAGSGKHSREELFAEAQQLGLRVNPSMSDDEVHAMITKFFG